MSGPSQFFLMFDLCLVFLGATGCSSGTPSARVIYSNHLDSLDTVLTRRNVTLQNGSVRIDATEPTTVRLVEIRPNAPAGATLVFRGHLRSEALKGRAYFRICCSVPASTERCARGLSQSVSGTADWTTQATPLVLAQGERCETARLDVVIEGMGIVRVHNIAVGEISPN